MSMSSWSMFPPPLKRTSTTIPSAFQNRLISFLNRSSEGWFMDRMCT